MVAFAFAFEVVVVVAFAFEVVVAFTGSSMCATPPARRSYELGVVDAAADGGG